MMLETKPLDDTSISSHEEASLPGQEELFHPTTLILASQTIYALMPDSPPLYYLSLGIADLLDITTKVELSRLEPNKGGSGRQRNIYDLKHMRSVLGGYEKLLSDSPQYFIKHTGRRLPDPVALGIKKGTSTILGKAAHLTAVPVDISSKTSKHGIPNFYKDATAVFAINGRELTDAQGNAVAVMHDDKVDKQHSLMVTASLPRGQFDMLVALRCCHIWESSVANTAKVHEGISGVARKMRQAKEFGFGGFSGPVGGGGAAGGF